MIDASIALLKCVIDYGLCIWAFSWFAKRKSENRALFLGSIFLSSLFLFGINMLEIPWLNTIVSAFTLLVLFLVVFYTRWQQALEQLVLFLIIMLTVNIVAIIIENLDGLLTQKMQLEITRNFGKPVFEYIQNVPLYHMSDSNFVADKERAINAVENDILLVVQNINGSIALIVSIIVLSVMVAQYDVLALVVLIIMVEVRKEVSDMPCGNAIPAEDAGHQTEKDVAGRESDRVPAPEMNPKVQLELLSGEGRKKAIGAVVIYNAVTIRGISVVENSKKNPFVKMPRAPKGARTKHSDIAYPINRAAREMLYSAVLQEYDRLRSEEELRRQETKLQIS